MLPTGHQHVLRSEGPNGPVTATVAELAAGIRALSVDGEDLVQRYPDAGISPSAAGIVLVPWPNRIRGARWNLDGQEQALDVTEPASGNASHGLLRNTGYAATDRSDDAVTLAATVFPQHGYPFLLQTSVRYELVEDGLRVTHGIVNAGDRSAPVAIGAHPFLRAGTADVEDLTIRVRGARMLEVDEKNIPVGSRPVDGNADLREGRRVGDLELDVCLTDLELEDGAYRHFLTAPGGVRTELWAGEDFPYAQVFTKRGFPGPDGAELAVAIEPMTAPADAFNSGEGLRWLAPGDEWITSWGIRRVA